MIYISSAKRSGEAILPRNLIIAEADSKLTVVESYISTGNVAYFTNAVTEILAGDNAVVEHVKFQDEAPDAFHIATIAGEFGRASNVTRPFLCARRKIFARRTSARNSPAKGWSAF